MTFQVSHHCSGSLSATNAGEPRIPALMSRISRFPNSFSTNAAASLVLFREVTSIFTSRTCGTERWASAAAFRTASVAEVREERAPIAMWDAPAWAKDFAIDRPIPFEAPTTKTALFRGGIERGEMAGYVSL